MKTMHVCMCVQCYGALEIDGRGGKYIPGSHWSSAHPNVLASPKSTPSRPAISSPAASSAPKQAAAPDTPPIINPIIIHRSFGGGLILHPSSLHISPSAAL